MGRKERWRIETCRGKPIWVPPAGRRCHSFAGEEPRQQRPCSPGRVWWLAARLGRPRSRLASETTRWPHGLSEAVPIKLPEFKRMSTSCLPIKPLNLIVLLFLGFGSAWGKYSAENNMHKQSTPYSEQFPSCSLVFHPCSAGHKNG